MTTTHTHRAPSRVSHTPRHARRRGARPRTRQRRTSPLATSPQGAAPRGSRRSVLMVVVASLGLGLVLYPSAASWFATLGHNSEISGYTQEVENLPTATTRALLADAREYNARLPHGQLRDPAAAPGAGPEDLAVQDAAYRAQLDPGSSAVMGRLRYRAIDADLPIYHGTGDDVLSGGVGHLVGSSLPVGGDGTHSVLTSHSGMASSTLFTNLLEARVGDQFTVDVLDEHLYYRVDQITTVDPVDVASLVIEDGKDYVTLVTCTPIGVNSHRLLVRGVRVAGPPSTDRTDGMVAGGPTSVDFPSWAVAFVGGSLAFAFAPRLGAGLRTRSDDGRGRHGKRGA